MAQPLLHCMTRFRELYNTIDDPKVSVESWRRDVRAFGVDMVRFFGNYITKMVYFHIFVCHVVRWKEAGGLARWSSHRSRMPVG